jgi:2,3-bisphosphoglycerate-independent phosphoglycerate mutase
VNVHSHVAHLRALIHRAHAEGVKRIRVHALTDGRDVSERSALTWIEPLEAELAALPDACIASGGGRMRITMDRYEADWDMVKRGWDCHVHGVGRPFPSASAAIRALYAEDPATNDQLLAPFVIVDAAGAPRGRIADHDAVVLFNFRGDRAIEISRAFEAGADFAPFDRSGPDGRAAPQVLYAGMMQYDGDAKIPGTYLVDPPAIDRTVGQYLAAAGVRSYAISETQKFGHVTYFFNGNRSGLLAPALEVYEEVPSDRVSFDRAPDMQAREICARACAAVGSGRFDHVRLNLANGDMVGHTGDFDATVRAMETVDACVAELEACTRAAGGVLIVTADHGNADEMCELDKKGQPVVVDGRRKPRTAHSLNPVPFILADFSGQWQLDEAAAAGAGIANIGGTVLALAGIALPEGYLPALVQPRA